MSRRPNVFRRYLIAGFALPTLALAGCAGTPRAGEGGSGAAASAPGISLRLIGEAHLPHRMAYEGSVVGGLSGIDYDEARGHFYLLSDDRSEHGPARFYTAKIALDARTLGTPELVAVTTLKQPDGSTYGSRAAGSNDVPDPESIRYRAETDTLLWSSEGDKALGLDPVVREMRLDGTLIRELPTLPMLRMQPGEHGARDNLSFEGLALTPDGKGLWVSMEAPRYEDGPVPSVDGGGGAARITLVHAASGNPIRQIAYPLDAIPKRPTAPGVADNGISEILMLDQFRLFVLERSYSPGAGNSLRLYLIDVRDGSDVLAVDALREGKYTPVEKRLVVDFDRIGLSRLDNTEGMTFGPRLANGNRTLLFVSDDNFRASQITQFVAFELIEPKPVVSYVIEPPPLWWPYPYFGYRPWIWPRPIHPPRPMPRPKAD